ncbi:HD domain-containing protein [Synechococcus sp. CBW1107]|uniref:HD domain-containing protein n=2 Tax=unclassified Synechococcus TaxID=2626047 RepID=UPI002AD2D342|nr:HD domain-containing protein [Synechococcus sp. CBW1107]
MRVLPQTMEPTPQGERMRFHRMDEMSPDDFRLLRTVHEQNLLQLPDLLLDLLERLGGDEAYPVDRRTHSLQAATRALRDGRDEETVVVALLHDVGEALGPLNHGEVIAAILKPFIREENHWMLAHHPVFQTYFYGSQVGIDPNGREAYRESPHFAYTAEFCALYDEVSFDPDYPQEPIETFIPMVRRVLRRPWDTPAPEPETRGGELN